VTSIMYCFILILLYDVEMNNRMGNVIMKIRDCENNHQKHLQSRKYLNIFFVNKNLFKSQILSLVNIYSLYFFAFTLLLSFCCLVLKVIL
jgi:hypothetical protein